MGVRHWWGPADPPGYRADLDGLRAVAVVLVMLAHAGPPWGNGGDVGVTAFFVLSGFLITGILQSELRRTGRLDLLGFYRRRIKRLGPALAVLLAVTTSLGIVAGGSIEQLAPVIGSILYINNWLVIAGVPMEIVAHTWSLAIEEQFYLLWPIALIVLGPRRALMIALALAAASALARVGADGRWEYFSTVTRADAILVGSALALFAARAALPPVVAVLGLVGLVIASLSDLNHDMVIPLAIVSAAAVITSRLPALGRVAPVGRRAYSLYLWNWPLTLLFGPIAFVLTIPISELSYRVAERPFMRRPTTAPTPVRAGAPSSTGLARPGVAVTAGALALLLVASCAAPPTATPASPPPAPCPRAAGDSTTCILVLGDSIAAGDGAAPGDRWPAQLEVLLRQAAPDHDVVVSNWAHGGSEIDLLERRVAELPLDSYEVAIVITGVNDTVNRGVDEWAPRYAAAIDRLEAAGVTVVIGTAPPTFEGGVFTDQFAAVAERLRTIAGDRPMLDIAKEWKDLGVDGAGSYYLDMIHPNAAGQALIARRAKTILDGILPRSVVER